MFYALCVKIFFSLSELEELKHLFPFFRKGPPLFFTMLVRTSFTICKVRCSTVGNKLNIDTYDIITSDLREYFRMLAMHSDTYSPLSGFLDPSQ